LFVEQCYYCKFAFLVVDLTVEHITPFCLGGTNDETNIALACAECNKEKGKEAWEQKRRLNRVKYGRDNLHLQIMQSQT